MFKIISASINVKLAEKYIRLCKRKGLNKSKRIESLIAEDYLEVKKIKTQKW